jgi:L-rhamnose-H+ transport protein
VWFRWTHEGSPDIGVMSAVFNVGYSLALPIAETGQRLGYPRFLATNCIWLLMLGAGSLPNIAFCARLLVKNRSGTLFSLQQPHKTWGLGLLMGLLWGGSIFLYGAATPLLGDIGPSIGWPLSLAVALLVANLMGLLLGEWRTAPAAASRKMRRAIVTLLGAITLCAISTSI